MAKQIIECIPNFSEARNPEVIDAIIQSIQSIQGVYILDRHSDFDHNRSVITFVGSPNEVLEAAYQSIRTASQLIDMNQHTGAHPRIGAADVIPFVPINGVTMQECVELARSLGKRVAGELSIPVYLYEEAATRPERRNLEDIRRGEFEMLKQEISSNPERKPDFGPPELGSAGATVIGARNPLIAFNIYLTTNEVWIAQEIARAIRHSSGGLRFVKALGLLVEGRAQVSMNLTNYHQTPIGRVTEMVRREAARYGVNIHHSELVGLLPQEALVDAASWYLQLNHLNPDQILEQRLHDVLLSTAPSEQSLNETQFLDELARGTPSPGGGSAAAFTGAQAAALVAMVARLTVGKPKYVSVEKEMWKIIEQAEKIRSELTACVQKDAQAFEEVLSARRLPKMTPEQQSARNGAIKNATEEACKIPFQIAQYCNEILYLAIRVAQVGNQNAITDCAAAVFLARSAIFSAGLNIKINAVSIPESQIIPPMMKELCSFQEHTHQIEMELSQILKNRVNISI